MKFIKTILFTILATVSLNSMAHEHYYHPYYGYRPHVIVPLVPRIVIRDNYYHYNRIYLNTVPLYSETAPYEVYYDQYYYNANGNCTIVTVHYMSDGTSWQDSNYVSCN